VGYDLRIMDEQKLTNYEIGTKNQFLDNRLRVNASGFYYDVEGYPQVYELSTAPGPAQKVMTSTPIEVYGVDLEVEYLPTAHDKIQLAAGYQNPKLTGHTGDLMEWPFRPDTPEYEEFGPVVVTDADEACVLRTQPGHPKFQATLGYEHTFILANGSTLVPRADVNYTGSYYLEQMNWLQERWGAGPYNHQDAYYLVNANIAWTSPSKNYSVNLWVRNALDELYKAGPQRFGLMTVYFPGEDIPVGLGAPRTFGLSVSAKF
jgi:iron complex outermembrane receptor protein